MINSSFAATWAIIILLLLEGMTGEKKPFRSSLWITTRGDLIYDSQLGSYFQTALEVSTWKNTGLKKSEMVKLGINRIES
ncbi:hypothetical protein KEM48_005957 [Puccinia striiformis f. sp. tritici PST-130]|uniref:Secreted protein n=2 Tax=Puccinia striiformis TaxID=27350 RepID=A0A0L0VDN9_9BASI|nr:hypothetical protein H4Q26_006343 [Puccinia striiformis f. sp. tritici PST-130]KAI9614492.1 hypothetical protein KEM48_005957 [Puccinia striiformis f. sp. tritici PST-130]KNE97311.1 hypothetical protein PSTG_09422 [Puccinia striiformis f. sp. tritici PST-78]POW15486.1 hypothetical protein PSTT_02124 [Puccinia striiformis]